MYRILLVDDEPAVVKSLSNMIGQFKLPIVIGAVARSGLEALELLQQSPFDIVITDIRMAGMDGLTERKNFTIRGAWKLFYILSSSNAYATALSLQNVSSPNQMVLKYGSFSNMLEQLQQLVTGVVVNNEEPKTIANATFLNMLKFINANFTKGLTLQEVANEMNMNPNYLSVIFKREMNVTFSTYITELRITEAKALLKNKDLSISEIATQLGFNDYFYFLKTFKRITGITPKQYRNPEKAPDPGLSLNTQENE